MYPLSLSVDHTILFLNASMSGERNLENVGNSDSFSITLIIFGNYP